jgi:heme/copper-type cytochrome/quinol oxidase subunit 3
MNKPSQKIHPEHDEIESYSGQEAQEAQDTKEQGVDILVSVPTNIEVKMVDASTLSDYEIWFFSSSSLLSCTVGFVIAYIQAPEDKTQYIKSLLVTSLIFGVLFIFCVIMTFIKRHSLKKKGQTINLKTGKIIK